MKKVIAICLIAIIVLSFTACNKECPVIGTWEEKHLGYDGSLIESTLVIYENGYAEWRSWRTRANGEKEVNGSQNYDWEYSKGTLRLENKTFVKRLIYDASTGTLSEQGVDADEV